MPVLWTNFGYPRPMARQQFWNIFGTNSQAFITPFFGNNSTLFYNILLQLWQPTYSYIDNQSVKNNAVYKFISMCVQHIEDLKCRNFVGVF